MGHLGSSPRLDMHIFCLKKNHLYFRTERRSYKQAGWGVTICNVSIKLFTNIFIKNMTQLINKIELFRPLPPLPHAEH